jgi:hypothetical protein
MRADACCVTVLTSSWRAVNAVVGRDASHVNELALAAFASAGGRDHP